MSDKIYDSYDFSTKPHGPCKEVTFKLFLKKDVGEWKGFRTLLAMGARFESSIKPIKLNNYHTMMYVMANGYPDGGKCLCLQVVTSDELSSSDPEKVVEEALHSMYLWMENPHKYS